MVKTAKRSSKRPWWPWIILLLILISAAAVRVRVAHAPLERDEGEYAYAGQLLLQKVPPYQLAYNMKMPGTYVAYAAILAVFGESPFGIHLGMVFVNVATIILIFLLGRKLFDVVGGLVAAASYALLSVSHCFLAMAAHANHFVILFAVAGLLVLLKAQESNRRWWFFWGGILFGLAFLMKQQGVFFIPFALFSVVWQGWQTRPWQWKDLFKKMILLVAGSLVPFLITCIVLWGAGVFGRFWFWTFK